MSSEKKQFTEYDIIIFDFKQGKIKYSCNNDREYIDVQTSGQLTKFEICNHGCNCKSIKAEIHDSKNLRRVNININNRKIIFSNGNEFVFTSFPYLFFEFLFKVPHIMKDEKIFQNKFIPVLDDSLNDINLYIVKKLSKTDYAIVTPLIVRLKYDDAGHLLMYKSNKNEVFSIAKTEPLCY